MGYLPNVKRCELFKEFTEEKRKDFSISEKKIIHNFDTIILSCCLENDVLYYPFWDSESHLKSLEYKEKIKNLDYFLEEISEKIIDEKVSFYNLFLTKGYRMYRLNFNKTEFFDISFNTKKLPNQDTPRILIRLSSTALWTLGVKRVLSEVYENLQMIINYFELGSIFSISENRIDMAFHSNIIQDKENFFTADNLAKNYDGTLTKGQNIFTIDTKNNEIDLETLSLGSRKSNNIFFRIYDKTREVVEIGKKGFFLEMWLNNKVINKYDYYVLSRCYINKSYSSRFEYMAEYYLEFSKNEMNKIKIERELFKLKKNNITKEKFKKFILDYCPKTTTVLNYEFETHRKYYETFKKIEELEIETKTIEIEFLRFYKIIDNISLFIKPLFYKQVVFKCAFWSNFQTLKMKKSCNIKMEREYRKCNLNKEKTCLDVVGKVAKLSTMINKYKENDIYNDIYTTVSYIFNSTEISNNILQKKADKTRKRTLSEIVK